MKLKILLLLVPFFLIGSIHAQETHDKKHENKKDFYQHRLAIFSGMGLIRGAVNEEGESVARPIPVVGIDYEFFFNHRMGIGLFNDFEIASYVIPFNDTEVLGREYAFVTAAVFLYEPVLGLTLFAGPGYEIEKNKSFTVFKVGTEISKNFEDGWSAGLSLSYDFKEVNSSLSIGLTIVKGIGKPK